MKLLYFIYTRTRLFNHNLVLKLIALMKCNSTKFVLNLSGRKLRKLSVYFLFCKSAFNSTTTLCHFFPMNSLITLAKQKKKRRTKKRMQFSQLFEILFKTVRRPKSVATKTIYVLSTIIRS